jgi:hypothetical protein
MQSSIVSTIVIDEILEKNLRLHPRTKGIAHPGFLEVWENLDVGWMNKLIGLIQRRTEKIIQNGRNLILD